MNDYKFSGIRKDNGKIIKGYYRKYYPERHQIGRNIATKGYYFQWFDVISETVKLKKEKD